MHLNGRVATEKDEVNPERQREAADRCRSSQHKPSRTFKDMCSLSTYGVEEKIDLTPEETDPSKKKFIKKVTPLEDWIAEQKAQNP